MRHPRAIPVSVAAGRAGLDVYFFANFFFFFYLHSPSFAFNDLD